MIIGIVCGTLAAFAWAAGFVVAKHGIQIGFSPADLAFHRFFWSGLLMLPLIVRDGPLRDLGGVGWGRGFVMTILSGPPQSLLAYSGFILVPLGHGTTIQPACAALSGLILAGVILHESISLRRMFGGAAIIIGLLVFGAESLATIGGSGVGGDLLFVFGRCVLGIVRDAAAALERAGHTRGDGCRHGFGDRLRAGLSFHLWLERTGTPQRPRKSSTGRRAGRDCRIIADLSVRPCGHRTRRWTRGNVSGFGAGVRSGDRIPRTRRGAESRASRRHADRAVRLSTHVAALNALRDLALAESLEQHPAGLRDEVLSLRARDMKSVVQNLGCDAL